MRIRDFDFKKTLKGSNGYSNIIRCYHTTLKGSNGYRKTNDGFYTTPSGSHNSFVAFFYKHPIPSGLFINSMEADIQKGINELKQLM